MANKKEEVLEIEEVTEDIEEAAEVIEEIEQPIIEDPLLNTRKVYKVVIDVYKELAEHFIIDLSVKGIRATYEEGYLICGKYFEKKNAEDLVFRLNAYGYNPEII